MTNQSVFLSKLTINFQFPETISAAISCKVSKKYMDLLLRRYVQ